MPEVTKISPPKPNNLFLFWSGLMFLLLSKIKNLIGGYRSPRAFSINEIDRGIEYDFNVVNGWLRLLGEYTGDKEGFKKKRVLELGPGADLGVAILILLEGAEKYNSLDRNELIKFVPEHFYETLFSQIKSKFNTDASELEALRAQLRLTLQGNNDRINYICRDDFDSMVFDEERIDIVVSQAAFEHFDDMGRTFSQLSKVVTKGCVLISIVDLKTHSRWIRDVDPLNIYRYDNFIYKLLRCPGIPNRLRPFQYKALLEKHGWTKVKALPLVTLDKSYVEQANKHLNEKFRDPANQMDYLSIALMATKL